MKYRRHEAKEYARANIRGLWIGWTTAFTPDLQLDEAGIRHDLRHFLDKLDLIGGMFSPSVIGEVWAMSDRERNRALEIMIEEARGQVAVAATITATSPIEAIELGRFAQDVGADYVVLSQPYAGHPQPDERAVYQFYKMVCDALDIGVIAFNSELLAGYTMSSELIGEIARLETVAVVKDPDGVEHNERTRQCIGGHAIFCCCVEDRWLENHLKGQPAMITNYTPQMFQTPDWQPIAEYTRLLDQGKIEEARKVSASLQPVRDLYEKWCGPWMRRRVMPAPEMKYWCELMGMAGGSVRPPLSPLSEETKAGIREDLIRVGLVKPAVRAGARS